MSGWLPLAIVGMAMAVLMIGLSRHQTRRHRTYPESHAAEAARMTAAQDLTRRVVEARTAALERIAAALEQRKP
jgi:hypothetical protein